MTFNPLAPQLRPSDIPDPDDANDILGYVSDVIEEANELRLMHSVLTLKFTSITESSALALRKVFFQVWRNCVVTSIDCQLVVTAGACKVSLLDVATPPAGITNPIWRSDAASTYTLDRASLTLGSTHSLRVEPLEAGGTFSCSGYVHIYLSSDKFSGAPINYSAASYNDGEEMDPDTLQIEMVDAETIAAQLDDNNGIPGACCAFTFEGVTSGTNIAERRVRLPKFYSDRATGYIRHMFLEVVTDVATTGLTTATVTTGATGVTLSVTLSASSAGQNVISQNPSDDIISDAATNATTDTSKDMILELSTNIPDTVVRATVILWFCRLALG